MTQFCRQQQKLIPQKKCDSNNLINFFILRLDLFSLSNFCQSCDVLVATNFYINRSQISSNVGKLQRNQEEYVIKLYCLIRPVYLMLLFEYIYEK